LKKQLQTKLVQNKEEAEKLTCTRNGRANALANAGSHACQPSAYPVHKSFAISCYTLSDAFPDEKHPSGHCNEEQLFHNAMKLSHFLV